MTSRFHCCATCVHFIAEKKMPKGMSYSCTRLGYDTKPNYIFQCWQPTVKVKKLIEKEANLHK